MNEDLLIEIIEAIKEQADELNQKEEKTDVEYGTLLGLAESLSIIKDASMGYDLKKLGLDFDIDKKYL